jgi:hypothetical protein
MSTHLTQEKKIIDEQEDFEFEGKREETTFLIHMIAGSIAGLMEHVAIYPIDTIKVNKISIYKIFIDSYANKYKKSFIFKHIRFNLQSWRVSTFLEGFSPNWNSFGSCSRIVFLCL